MTLQYMLVMWTCFKMEAQHLHRPLHLVVSSTGKTWSICAELTNQRVLSCRSPLIVGSLTFWIEKSIGTRWIRTHERRIESRGEVGKLSQHSLVLATSTLYKKYPSTSLILKLNHVLFNIGTGKKIWTRSYFCGQIYPKAFEQDSNLNKQSRPIEPSLASKR